MTNEGEQYMTTILLVVWWRVASLKKQTRKHNFDVAATLSLCVTLLFCFFSFFVHWDKTEFQFEMKPKWNSITLELTIPTAKFMFVCRWGGALRTDRKSSRYILQEKGRNRNTVQQIVCTQTQVVVSRTRCHIILLPLIFFKLPEVIGSQRGDSRSSPQLVLWLTAILLCTGHTSLSDEKSIFYLLFYVQHTAVMPRIDNNVDYICDTIITNVGICMKSSLKKKENPKKQIDNSTCELFQPHHQILHSSFPFDIRSSSSLPSPSLLCSHVPLLGEKYIHMVQYKKRKYNGDRQTWSTSFIKCFLQNPSSSSSSSSLLRWEKLPLRPAPQRVSSLFNEPEPVWPTALGGPVSILQDGSPPFLSSLAPPPRPATSSDCRLDLKSLMFPVFFSENILWFFPCFGLNSKGRKTVKQTRWKCD